ncbi:pantoate--beta-alanine ligase [Euzebya sp.]|uniref:pantoate--beta-alanine ligase n=1 Tax=Euzebya sp. TaxID=1971409 RepID=UPI003513EFE9
MADAPAVARTSAAVRAALDGPLRAGRSIGLVPTMGALHEGHLSLVRAARAGTDVVVVSIFVNPLQFGPGEDLDAYPRTFDADLAALTGEGVDLVFAPEATAYTPADARTTVHVVGLTDGLEAASRPTHFDGVTTIVTKLFSTVRPHRAYFGEKDFQQQAVIRRMARDLDLGVEVITRPVVRDPDGLALSSRNTYLSPDERRDALALSAALAAAQRGWAGDADATRADLLGTLGSAPGVRLDYAEVIDPETLEPLEGVHDGPAQAVVAAHVGDTRLIDTAPLQPASTDRA